MRDVKDLTKKDLAAILYNYYCQTELEDDFSFDKGILRKKIEKHLEQLNLTDSEIDAIEDKIILNEEEGSDYETLNFKFNEVPKLFLQVTSMFDYDGHCCSDEYKGDSKWCDVGMFFVDYNDVEFESLDLA